ncbi:UvrB/UvrC motif-containing protein [Caenibacillus caldisaponilyticus]|jgi:protein arginine kinase activator|uniref:UvrB/UvrC motif-containing protein n=1 Tax=Caenibacillus caldisaponilyticus TaxID=1674942 RepID=UPI00098839B5|nr:UvrB/UvrC motif-containing protein [Caenibacillus caldisaponilyticus]
MECQECHLRPATLHFTKIVNGKKMEVHLCEQCAREKGEVMAGSNAFSIHNLLSGLLNFEEMAGHSDPFEEPSVLQCPKCGLTYSDFIKVGKFGCAECYRAFRDRLDPILRKVHAGNTVHTGKVPKRTGKGISIKRKIKELKEKLQRLVANEEFEEAAKVRDEIRALEKEGDVS